MNYKIDATNKVIFIKVNLNYKTDNSLVLTKIIKRIFKDKLYDSSFNLFVDSRNADWGLLTSKDLKSAITRTNKQIYSEQINAAILVSNIGQVGYGQLFFTHVPVISVEYFLNVQDAFSYLEIPNVALDF